MVGLNTRLYRFAGGGTARGKTEKLLGGAKSEPGVKRAWSFGCGEVENAFSGGSGRNWLTGLFAIIDCIAPLDNMALLGDVFPGGANIGGENP